MIRSGLRLLELQKKKIDAINEALVTGEMSGDPVDIDNEEFKRLMHRKHGLKA